MSELHTVNKSPFEKSSVDSCLAHVQEGSAVLFYEDAVYAAMEGTSVSSKVKAAAGVKLYALGPDVAARGIPADRLIAGVEVIDYEGFVDLSVQHSKVVAWV